MTDRPTRRSTRQVDFATETLMSRRRLPGESTPDCDALIEMLRADLNPGTAYEHVICQNLVELELEAASYRRIRDDLIRNSFRKRIEDKIFGVFAPESPEKRQFFENLFGDDPAGRREALDELSEAGLDEGEELARAYADKAKTLEQIERNLSEIEVRRRRLRADYDQLKAGRRQVEDAEVVADYGD